MNVGLWAMAQTEAINQREKADDLETKNKNLKDENDSLKKQLHTAKELLKYYYSRYEFCGTAKAPSWKVKEDTEKLLKGEEGREYFYPSEYYEKEKTND